MRFSQNKDSGKFQCGDDIRLHFQPLFIRLIRDGPQNVIKNVKISTMNYTSEVDRSH